MKAWSILFFLIPTLVLIQVKAQRSQVHDYYITNADDTIPCLIRKRSREHNNEYFVFKLSKKSSSTKFYPKDAMGYAIGEKEYYESHPIKYTKTQDTLGFFRVVTRGKISLLSYKSRYFVKTSTGEITELTPRQIPIAGPKWDNFHGAFYKPDYSGLVQLKFLMADCPALVSTLDLEYRRQPNFPAIFRQYFRCVGIVPDIPKKFK